MPLESLLSSWMLLIHEQKIMISKCTNGISSSSVVIVRVRVVLKRTVVGDWRFDNLSGSRLQSQEDSEDDFRSGCRNVSQKTLKTTSAQVVETSVTNNRSFQKYSHPDDHNRRTTVQMASNWKPATSWLDTSVGRALHRCRRSPWGQILLKFSF